jgi:hypothetical protein
MMSRGARLHSLKGLDDTRPSSAPIPFVSERSEYVAKLTLWALAPLVFRHVRLRM